jgi:hypothetical protein
MRAAQPPLCARAASPDSDRADQRRRRRRRFLARCLLDARMGGRTMIETALGIPATMPDQIRLSFEIGAGDVFAVVALLALGGLLAALSALASEDARDR